MNKPHKHQALIIQWAAGAEIQVQPLGKGDWNDVKTPLWNEGNNYRVKPMPLEWQAERDAYAAGKTIQYRSLYFKQWQDIKTPLFAHYTETVRPEYRVKPEPTVREMSVIPFGDRIDVSYLPRVPPNLRLAFEGDVLVGSTVLKPTCSS